MLKVVDVCAGYGKVQILGGVSIEVGQGSVVALLGGNGTGKSTALKTIMGFIRPSSGEVWFDGVRTDGVPAKDMIVRGLALVPQGKEVFQDMTVEENILMGAYHRRRDPASIRQDIQSIYEKLPQMRLRRSLRAGALSGGEREMLAIARALIGKPKFLMLDEPSAALSPKAVEDVIDILLRLKQDGMSLLLVEQNVSVALALAERLYIMRDGRIALERAVNATTSFDDLKSYYLGDE